MTPTFPGFYATHKEGFDAWQRGEGRGAQSHDAEITQAGAMAEPPPEPGPVTPSRPPEIRDKPPKVSQARQLDLFE